MTACKLCGNEFKRSRPDQNSQHHCSVLCRLKSKLDMSGGDTACWPWIAKSKHRFGYGILNVNGVGYTAHRVMWEEMHGVIGDKTVLVCHTCDNPLCCNPSHLFLGSPEDNQHDMMMKGRHGFKGKPMTEKHRRGLETYWASKRGKPIAHLAKRLQQVILGVPA